MTAEELETYIRTINEGTSNTGYTFYIKKYKEEKNSISKRKYRIADLICSVIVEYKMSSHSSKESIKSILLGPWDWVDFIKEEFPNLDPINITEILWSNYNIKLHECEHIRHISLEINKEIVYSNTNISMEDYSKIIEIFKKDIYNKIYEYTCSENSKS